jgi:hypothetical protein
MRAYEEMRGKVGLHVHREYRQRHRIFISRMISMRTTLEQHGVPAEQIEYNAYVQGYKWTQRIVLYNQHLTITFCTH